MRESRYIAGKATKKTLKKNGFQTFQFYSTVISTNPQGDFFLSDFGLKKRVSSEISKPDRFQTIRDMKK